MFKDVLKQLRIEKGLTQLQLAEALGLQAGTIGNYEQGQRLPRDDKQWIEIARFFNVSVDYLMDACPMICDSCESDCETHQYAIKVAYNGSDTTKTEIKNIVQHILDTVEDETQLKQIKMYLDTYIKK